MKFLKSYKSYKESTILLFDIDESLSISDNILMSSVNAKEVDMFDTLKLPKDFYKGKLSVEFLHDNIEFTNSLTSIGLKKSQMSISDDYECFINKPCKWMFIYDISSNELENPLYIAFQVWNETIKEWDDVKLFKINGDVKKFYDKLSSKTIEVTDGDENYIYTTADGNTWELQNLDKENDVYKRFFRKDELQSLLNDRKVTVSII
jgi:hypothetical protein